jgi:hypothetical protein
MAQIPRITSVAHCGLVASVGFGELDVGMRKEGPRSHSVGWVGCPVSLVIFGVKGAKQRECDRVIYPRGHDSFKGQVYSSVLEWVALSSLFEDSGRCIHGSVLFVIYINNQESDAEPSTRLGRSATLRTWVPILVYLGFDEAYVASSLGLVLGKNILMPVRYRSAAGLPTYYNSCEMAI